MASTTKTPPSDAATAMSMLMWARDKGVAISELQVGAIRLVVTDIKLVASNVRQRDDSDAASSLYHRVGGALIDQARRALEEDQTFDDEDEEDEVPKRPGRREGSRGRAPRR